GRTGGEGQNGEDCRGQLELKFLKHKDRRPPLRREMPGLPTARFGPREIPLPVFRLAESCVTYKQARLRASDFWENYTMRKCRRGRVTRQARRPGQEASPTRN